MREREKKTPKGNSFEFGSLRSRNDPLSQGIFFSHMKFACHHQ